MRIILLGAWHGQDNHDSFVTKNPFASGNFKLSFSSVI